MFQKLPENCFSFVKSSGENKKKSLAQSKVRFHTQSAGMLPGWAAM